MEEEIFARIENSQNNQCYEITSFNVIVAALPTAFPVADFVVCDDESNDGIASFDLTSINDQVFFAFLPKPTNICHEYVFPWRYYQIICVFWKNISTFRGYAHWKITLITNSVVSV